VRDTTRIRVLLVLLGGALACDSHHPGPTITPAPPTAAVHADLPVPTLRLLHSRPAPEGALVAAPLALGADGEVVLALSGKDDDPRLAILTPAGMLKHQFARTGSGPGELRLPAMLWVESGAIRVFDGRELRLLTFDRAGRFQHQAQWNAPAFPFAVAGDTAWFATMNRDARVTYRMRRPDRPDVDLVDERDTLFLAMTPSDGPRAPLGATYDEGRLAFANATTGQIAWTRDGGTVATAEMALPVAGASAADLERARAKWKAWRGPDGKALSDPEIDDRLAASRSAPPLAFARSYGLGFDGKGRLWVWRDQTGHLSVSLFFDGRPVGELPIDCPDAGRAWDVRGDRLAALCSGAGGGLELRVWGIEEGVATGASAAP